MVSIPFPNNGSNKNFKKDFNNEQSGLVPPQNVQAEEVVLGGILLDPDAIGRIADLIKPEAFYINAHQEIYKTALMLHTQGKPTDLTSMSAWLADNGSLEKIGGNSKLVELVENVSSTASIEQVANLISDKFIRRQLIRSGNEVVQLGFDQTQETNEVLDKAEQKIFEISQEKPTKGLTQAAEILTSTFNEIESRSLGASVAGIPVNFYDLDAMTQGFQRSDLIIVAGRPSMGKTSMVLNLAKNVAQSQDLPVCVFSLEMSKEQLTYRLLSMEVGIESGRLRTGRLQQEEWPLLGEGINSLGQLPIFIDDKPNLSVLEMRSLCRRLIAEQKKELGLIVIDYLQLIRSGNEVVQLGFDQTQETNEVLDKAEQKIFEISQEKPTKGLTQAAEILTSTFNEIESRSLGASVAGIPVNFYDLDAMTQGFQRSDLIIVAGRPSMGKTSMVLNLAKNVAQSQDLPVCVFSLEMSKEQLTYRLLSMEVGIESGRLRTGRLQQEEWPLLGEGINSLGQLPIFIDDKPNLSVLEMRSLCRRLIAEQKKELGLIVIDYLQLMEGTTPDNRVQELSRITRGLKSMARELKVPVVALSQLSRGVESRTNKRPMLSDLRESGSIEQDADLVLMIYRDEYYNPETEDRGITEIIVTKHRNGPVGTVKLLFEPQFTRFRNLAN